MSDGEMSGRCAGWMRQMAHVESNASPICGASAPNVRLVVDRCVWNAAARSHRLGRDRAASTWRRRKKVASKRSFTRRDTTVFSDREVNRLIQQAVQQEAKDVQRLFDQLARQYKGRPVAVIKPALKRAWERSGGKITDPELTEYSEAISNGRHIKMKIG